MAAALDQWRRLDTTEVVASMRDVTDPSERLCRFLEMGFGRRRWGRVFAALCASAADPLVDPVMTQVREARLEYLEQALTELGLHGLEAHDRATLIYATYVGYWRLVAADDEWEYNQAGARDRMADHVIATMIPGRPAAGRGTRP